MDVIEPTLATAPGENRQLLIDTVDQLRKLISGHGRSDIRYDQEGEVLGRFARASKYDAQRALRMMTAFYDSRAAISSKMLAAGRGPRDVAFYAPMHSVAVLADRNADGSAVIMFRKGLWEPCDGLATLADAFTFGFYAIEVAMRTPQAQLDGITVVFDATGFGFRHLPHCDMSCFRFILNCLCGAYPIRIRAIHVLSVPTVFRFVVALFRSVLSKKMNSRLHVHLSRKDLYKHINKTILPEEYSDTSTIGAYSSDDTYRNMCNNHEWLIERSYYGVRQ